MPNYRYNTPDYMRQNHSNGCHVGGNNRTMPPSVSPSTPSRPCCNIYDHDKLSGLSIAMAYVPWQSGVLSMKLKKDSSAELFLPN